MHDINWIRTNPKEFDENLARRGHQPEAARLITIDEKRRKLVTELQQLQQARNEKSKAIGAIKDKSGQEFINAKSEVDVINKQMEEFKIQIETLESELIGLLETIPNLLDENVPTGADENDNTEVRRNGTPKVFSFTPKQHFELGEALGMMDFEQTAVISGSRFVTLKGDLARLERALANFMLDNHTKNFGYIETSPPALVRDSAAYGVGQLPKFAEDSFQTTNGYRLISTSEVSLTNLVAERIVPQAELPLRYTAYTPCFRSEAGSAGRDTRGMIRLHQFNKVELVCICDADNYQNEYENLVKAAESILIQLELPYLVMALCSGDISFSSSKTLDFEVWLPGQDKYREISSCSMFGQFQARRMKAKYRDSNKETNFLYTLNGSGLAVGRTIVAILENYQNEDGSITIPKVLQPYMGGQKLIG